MTDFKLEIDPRLTSGTQSLFVNAPPPSFAANPVRLPPLQRSDSNSTATPPILENTLQPYHHLTPTPPGPSSGNVDRSGTGEPLGHVDGSGDPSNDPKRPRACEACRGLKVRCEPDLNKPEGACRRCAKAGRQCIVTVPSRKRQKKTDSRVAELEKKIDALTASLHATRSGRAESETDDSQDETGVPGEEDDARIEQEFYSTFPNSRVPAKDWPQHTHKTQDKLSTPSRKGTSPTHPSPVVSGQKRRRSEEPYAKISRASSETSKPVFAGSSAKDSSTEWKDDGPNLYPFLMPKGARGNITPCMYPTSTTLQRNNNSSQNYDYADVIDRRLIDSDTATLVFDRYVNSMAPHMPAVVFPPGTTAADVRKNKPALFLAILSAGSGIAHPDVQRTLAKEIMRVYGDRIICNGEKSLELIQALHVSTLWYWPPDNYEELKFYQLTHIAAVMALDIGLGKRVRPLRQRHLVGLWRDSPWRRERLPGHEPVEGKRTWLSCYFLSANVSMAARRPNLIRWSPYMNECISTLETSPEAYASDRVLCQWVRAQHIAEEIGLQFSMDDSFASCSISDLKVQYALKGFERQMEDWKLQVPPDVQRPTLKLCEHVLNLYMHEVVMHVDHNVDDFRAPFTEETLKGAGQQAHDLLTPASVNALSCCLASIHGVFDTFLLFDLETTRTIPVFHFVRVAYAAVVLIKMYFVAATPGSELGKIFSLQDIKVEPYLGSLLDAFRATADNDHSRPASKFLMVLVMLKTWFQRQKDGKGPKLKDGSCTRSNGHNGTMVMSDTSGYPRSRGLTDVQEDIAASRRLQEPPVQGTLPAEDKSSSCGARLENRWSKSGFPNYNAANTPLQLLSEVAMGDSKGAHARRNGTIADDSVSSGWYNSKPSVITPSADCSITYLTAPNDSSDSVINQPGSTVGIAGDSGLETAMEMTLGDGDFSSIFLEEGFFNFMDGAPSVFDNWG
ncbi:MAG: hypothetical protein M1812_004460 [Candelaria pacifica]|nr:MAG: hypothetical protein M1812_004460 [Candelaria pacifica]